MSNGASAALMDAPESISMSPELVEAYESCRRIVRARARNFYYGLRVIPEPKRSAIYSIYAWMRLADDLTDEDADPTLKAVRLAEFREHTESLIAGQTLPPDHGNGHTWLALGATLNSFPVDPNDLYRTLEGLEADVRHEAGVLHEQGDPKPIHKTREDLEEYCYCVASTVGRICTSIWGVRDADSLPLALSLAVRRGRAFQLTNILRDFVEDFDEGRVYLPAELFDRFEITPRDVRYWQNPDRANQLIAEAATWARLEYQESSSLESLIDPTCAPALWTMSRIYSGLLEMIEQNPARIAGSRRIRLQSLRKAGIALRAVMRPRDAW